MTQNGLFPFMLNTFPIPNDVLPETFLLMNTQAQSKKKKKIIEDYGWVWINVRYDEIFHSKQTNENLIGFSQKSEGTKQLL